MPAFINFQAFFQGARSYFAQYLLFMLTFLTKTTSKIIFSEKSLSVHMSVRPSRPRHVPVTSPQKVAETENFAKQSCQIHFRDATATTAAALLGEAKPSHIYTTQFRVSSPLHSQSQAVVCVSTPRKYPRSGYFLVNDNLLSNDNIIWIAFL